MEYDLQLIGARLQAARKAKGYTQDYVSARADITVNYTIKCNTLGEQKEVHTEPW